MSIIDRILQLHSILGTNSQGKLADALGLNRSNFSQMMQGKRTIGESVINKICIHANIDKQWLLTGEGEPMALPTNARRIDETGFMNVPLVNVRARCGYLSGFGDTEYVETLPTLPVIVDRTYHGRYMLFEADGDSMDDGSRNAICDKDIVLAREIKRELWDSKLHYNEWYFVIVTKSEGISIKKIVDHDVDNGILTCHSLNPLFRDYRVHLNDVLELYNVIKIVDRSVRL